MTTVTRKEGDERMLERCRDAGNAGYCGGVT
jgi:hypothetical protein